MTLVERLQKIRKEIAAGWVGPSGEGGEVPPWLNCKDTSGRPCSSLDEGLAKWPVGVAIAMICSTTEEILECWEAIEEIVAPVHKATERAFAAHRPEEVPGLPAAELHRLRLLAVSTIGRPTCEQWLADPFRQLSEVLKVFDKAILKAKER